MRVTLAGVVSAVAAGFAVVGLVVAIVLVREVSATRSQLTATSAQLAATRAALARVSAAANGQHRDLITCADLQQTDQYVDGIVVSQGSIGPVQFVGPGSNVVSSLPLPGHCINR